MEMGHGLKSYPTDWWSQGSNLWSSLFAKVSIPVFKRLAYDFMEISCVQDFKLQTEILRNFFSLVLELSSDFLFNP